MNRTLPILAAGAAALALTASASAQPARGGQCFSTQQITSTLPVGDRQVNVQVSHRDVYRIDLSQPCETLRRPSRFIELSPVASATSVCTPGEITLAAIADGARQECFVDKITRLSAAEVAALPPRQRP